MFQSLLTIIFALTSGLLNSIDSTNYWYDTSKDLKLVNTINCLHLIKAKKTIPSSRYLAPSTQQVLNFKTINCPFNNRTNVNRAKTLIFECLFYKDKLGTEQENSLIVTFHIEPTNNDKVTLLRKVDVAVKIVYSDDKPFFGTPYFDIPFLLLLAQEIKTPYVLTYIIDPADTNLRKPLMIELPSKQKMVEYFDAYRNFAPFPKHPKIQKKFASGHYDHRQSGPVYYTILNRECVNNLINYYNLK
jgi:hypothetical protein